jgi:hypothetical protein
MSDTIQEVRRKLDEMQKVCDAATPGPWKSDVGFVGADRRKFLIREPGMDRVLFGKHIVEAEEEQYDLDCDFTAVARTDLPACLTLISALLDEREVCRSDGPYTFEAHLAAEEAVSAALAQFAAAHTEEKAD